jgi:hypothetical protein
VPLRWTSYLLRGLLSRKFLLPLILVGAVALSLGLPGTQPAYALKDFALLGIVDCGLRSGQRCAIGDLLRLRTRDVGPVETVVVIDVTWMKRQVESARLEQDDLVCMEVRERPDGILQGLGFVEVCPDLEGTINPGLSTSSRDVAEQPRRPNEDDDPTPTATGTPAATATGTARPNTPTATATGTQPGTPTPTATGTLQATATPTATGTLQATNTATVTPTQTLTNPNTRAATQGSSLLAQLWLSLTGQ